MWCSYVLPFLDVLASYSGFPAESQPFCLIHAYVYICVYIVFQ
jgi:hypothetical protein